MPAGVSRGSVPETTVSINDDDDPAVEVSFELSSYSVAEGETETVTVTLGAAPERTVDITLIPTNQGASNSDYSGVPASVTFGPTETEQTFTFTAAQDSVDDDGESVKLTFGSQLPAEVSRGSVPETTVSINDDDDPAVEVSFELSSYSVAEGETETVTVTLGAAPERTVDITLIPTNQGASNSDYSGVPASVTFGPTETEQTFTFTATLERRVPFEPPGGVDSSTTPAFPPASPSAPRRRSRPSPSPRPRTAWTTTERASSSPSAAPCPRGCLEGASLRRPSPSTTTTIRRWR